MKVQCPLFGFFSGSPLSFITGSRHTRASNENKFVSLRWGLVICELRTGELVICELIVRTTDANLGYNANQKVRTFYAVKRGPYTCLCIRNTEMTFITIQNAERNQVSVHVTKIPQNYTCPLRRQLSALYWAYMPNQRINTAQKETHSKILPSPTYMEITKTV